MDVETIEGVAQLYNVGSSFAFAKILNPPKSGQLFLQPSSLLDVGQRYPGQYPPISDYLKNGDFITFKAINQKARNGNVQWKASDNSVTKTMNATVENYSAKTTKYLGAEFEGSGIIMYIDPKDGLFGFIRSNDSRDIWFASMVVYPLFDQQDIRKVLKLHQPVNFKAVELADGKAKSTKIRATIVCPSKVKIEVAMKANVAKRDRTKSGASSTDDSHGNEKMAKEMNRACFVDNKRIPDKISAIAEQAVYSNAEAKAAKPTTFANRFASLFDDSADDAINAVAGTSPLTTTNGEDYTSVFGNNDGSAIDNGHCSNPIRNDMLQNAASHRQSPADSMLSPRSAVWEPIAPQQGPMTWSPLFSSGVGRGASGGHLLDVRSNGGASSSSLGRGLHVDAAVRRLWQPHDDSVPIGASARTTADHTMTSVDRSQLRLFKSMIEVELADGGSGNSRNLTRIAHDALHRDENTCPDCVDAALSYHQLLNEYRGQIDGGHSSQSSRC